MAQAPDPRTPKKAPRGPPTKPFNNPEKTPESNPKAHSQPEPLIPKPPLSDAELSEISDALTDIEDPDASPTPTSSKKSRKRNPPASDRRRSKRIQSNLS